MDSYRIALSPHQEISTLKIESENFKSIDSPDSDIGNYPIASDKILPRLTETSLPVVDINNSGGLLKKKEAEETETTHSSLKNIDPGTISNEEHNQNPVLRDSQKTSPLLFTDNNVVIAQLKSDKTNAKRRQTKRYYDKQLNLIKNYNDDEKFLETFSERDDDAVDIDVDDENKNCDVILSSVTLLANFSLFIAKIVAAVLSGSLVVLSSVIDSAMDLTTGGVIFCTARAIKKRDLYKYPRGRTRLEPLALVLISLIMGAASVQVIIKAVESMISKSVDPKVELPTLIIMISTVVVKIALMIVCYYYPSTNAKILAQDHRNDCISNTTAIVCAYLSYLYWPYLDPIAAIIVSLYILSTWMKTGFANIRILSGRTAEPEIINRVVKVCLDHKPKVDSLDTVFVYHFGMKYLVEVHVVLDKNVTLEKAHDISEPLQRKIERLSFVERAFVHVDYDTKHKPSHEHKLV